MLAPSTRHLPGRRRALAGTFPGKRLHLVQFAAPVQEAWLDSVKKTGVQIITYLPANAYLVYGEASSVGQLQSVARTSSFVQWDGAYLDAYKVHPRARAVDKKGRPQQIGTDHFAIQMVDDPGANASSLALIDSLKLAPILSQDRFLGSERHRPAASEPPDDVARQPEVVSIQPYVVPGLYDERQDQIISGNISGAGLRRRGTSRGWRAGASLSAVHGVGFAVDVRTTGWMTPRLYPIISASTSTATSPARAGSCTPGASRRAAGKSGVSGMDPQHAHHRRLQRPDWVPHTDAAGYRYGLGVAPFVKVGSSVIFDPNFTFPSYSGLQSRAYRDGARVSSNSWGATGGAYNSDARGIRRWFATRNLPDRLSPSRAIRKW
jgi:hypothetical protein